MKQLIALVVLWLSAATPCQLEAQALSNRQTVYVSEFTSDSNVAPRQLNSITDDFESLVSASNRYTLLERRRYGALLGEVRNEASLTGQPTLVDRLKRLNAEAVFFGRVEDDAADGSYVFYVTLVKLDRTSVKRQESLMHGLMNSRASRMTILRTLLESLVAEATLTASTTTATSGGRAMVGIQHGSGASDETVPRLSSQRCSGQSVLDACFEFGDAVAQGDRMTVTLWVINHGDARTMTIMPGYLAGIGDLVSLTDNLGNSYMPTQVQIGNRVRTALVANDVRTPITMQFTMSGAGVRRATDISLLRVNVHFSPAHPRDFRPLNFEHIRIERR